MAEFADRLGISKSSLQQLETGKRIPSPKRAALIAKKLGLPESSLIELSLRDTLYSSGLKYNVRLESA